MTPEQKQRLEQIEARNRARHDIRQTNPEWPEGEGAARAFDRSIADIDDLLSLVKSQEVEPRKHGDGRYCAHHDDDPAHTKECYDADDRPQMLSVPDGAGVYDEKGNHTLLAQNAIDRNVGLMHSACVERVKAAVLTERETKRIGSQIVGDVLAQMGVRGSKEEREGADVVATAWVAKIVERVSEESAVKLESLSIEKSGEGQKQ